MRSEAGGVHTRAENKTNHWTRRLGSTHRRLKNKLKTWERKIEFWPRGGSAPQMKSVVKKTPADIDLGRHQHGTGRKTEMNCVQKTPYIPSKIEITREEQYQG
jgi:hypothetical protein